MTRPRDRVVWGIHAFKPDRWLRCKVCGCPASLRWHR